MLQVKNKNKGTIKKVKLLTKIPKMLKSDFKLQNTMCFGFTDQSSAKDYPHGLKVFAPLHSQFSPAKL